MYLKSSLGKNSTDNYGKSKWLTELKPRCDGRHGQCSALASYFLNSKVSKDDELTQDLFDKYLQHISSNLSSYNICTSNYNTSFATILSFISSTSEKLVYETKYFNAIVNNMNDEMMLKLIKDQIKLDPNYVNKLSNENMHNNGYGGNSSIIGCVFQNANNRPKTTKFILDNMNADDFIKIIYKLKNNINSYNETFIGEFIKNNAEYFSKQVVKCKELINNLPYRPAIIKELFKIISNSTDIQVKNEMINKAISNLDKTLIITIFDSCKNKEIIPDEKMIDALLNKAYVNNRGSNGINNTISEIIDIFIMYGLPVNKNLIIKLLNKTCSINKIEKYGIPIDEDILFVCANHSYYPYKFNIKPPISVLIKECSKSDNLETIKKLKEYGGEYNVQCLIEACKNSRNGKVIKYLINDCGVKPNDLCVTTFQDTYKIEALEFIIKGYDPNKNKEIKKTNLPIDLDTNSTVIIQPREIEYDVNDKSLDFKLKVKIKKFFDYKKKTIKYIEIYELLLKYLINNKLVIGNYFVLNNSLAGILKLEPCTIMHIDQIHNILTYFIDPADFD